MRIVPPTDASHADIVFEAVNGEPRPRLPGLADGDRYLTLDQAAERFGRPRQQLLAEWLCTYGAGAAAAPAEPSRADPSSDPPSTSAAVAGPAGPTDAPVDAADAVTAPLDGDDDGELAGPPPEGAGDAYAEDDGRDDGLPPMVVMPRVVAVLRSQRFPGLSEADVARIYEYAAYRGFDPFSELWAERTHDRQGHYRLQINPTIEGLRARAERSCAYAGSEDAEFDYGSGWVSTAPKPGPDGVRPLPLAARCTVYKLVQGVRCPFRARVLWDNYYTRAEWQDDMPEVFLGKCAEAAALRKAFPSHLGKSYIPEEMTRPSAEPRRGGKRRGEPTPQATADGETFGSVPTELADRRGGRGFFPAGAPAKGGRRPRPDGRDDIDEQDSQVRAGCDDDDAPVVSERTFVSAVAEEFEFNDRQLRAEVLALGDRRIPQPHGKSERYWARFFDDVRRNPRAYGLVRVGQAAGA